MTIACAHYCRWCEADPQDGPAWTHDADEPCRRNCTYPCPVHARQLAAGGGIDPLGRLMDRFEFLRKVE